MADLTEAQEEALMFEAIGRALNAWTSIEGELATLFGALIVPYVAHDSVTSAYSFLPHIILDELDVGVKIKVIDAVMADMFKPRNGTPHEIYAMWARERDRIRKLSKRRNQLAHWHVINWQTKAPRRRMRLVPNDRSRSVLDRYSKAEREGFHVDEIGVWASAFAEAAKRIAPIYSRIGSLPRTHERFIIQVVNMLNSIQHCDPERLNDPSLKSSLEMLSYVILGKKFEP